MPILSLVRYAICKIIEQAGHGLKCLLMDKDTLDIVNMSLSRTELFDNHVFLFNLINSSELQNDVERFTEIHCICFLRKQQSSLDSLCNELRASRFGKYYIYFSQPLDRTEIRRLAESDIRDSVYALDVINIDFIPITTNVFLPSLIQSPSQHFFKWNNVIFEQCIRTIISLLTSMQKCPQIRYQQSSQVCKTLADQLFLRLGKYSNQFSFDIENPPTLLIVDRREDSVTPILNQWTYQAMLHELLGICKNQVSTLNLKAHNQLNTAQNINLNSADDEFYASNKYNNYGKLVTHILKLLNQYQIEHDNNLKITTIGEMKQFVENYPQFNKMSRTLSQHMMLISELSKMITEFKLMAISELEQIIVCDQNVDHKGLVSKIFDMLKDPEIRDIDALRLVSLYTLRYEGLRNTAISKFKDYLQNNRKLADKWILFLDCLPMYGGLNFRKTDIFNEEFSFRKIYNKSVNDDSNKYCQHVPYLVSLTEMLLKGKLDENKYPFVKIKCPIKNQKSSEIILFIIGGLTYGEICAINTKFCKEIPRILLGSTAIHNYTQFIDEVLHNSLKQEN